MQTEREDSCLPAKERGLKRNKLRLLGCGAENKFLRKPGTCYGGSGKLICIQKVARKRVFFKYIFRTQGFPLKKNLYNE